MTMGIDSGRLRVGLSGGWRQGCRGQVEEVRERVRRLALT